MINISDQSLHCSTSAISRGAERLLATRAIALLNSMTTTTFGKASPIITPALDTADRAQRCAGPQ
ncbi:hypothetical protein GDR29_00430 [Xanthomonas oryzae pv. oryzae]|nr:hypothetical protein GDR29_00430 [Xanthomonas oryzae pv. oryzae]